MKLTTKKKRALFLEKWNACRVKGSSFEAQVKQLTKEAKLMDLTVKTGWMTMVGGFEEANFVQFNVPTYAWASSWPQWAYDLALQALLHNKKLLVLSDGEPLGDNLIQVGILWKDIA